MIQDPIINVYPPAGTPGWVNGLFILFGAIAGGGIAFLTAWLGDKRKLNHEIERQWDREIRDIAEKAVLLGRELSNTLLLADGRIKDGMAFIERVQESVNIETQLRLIGTGQIVEQFKKLYEAAVNVRVGSSHSDSAETIAAKLQIFYVAEDQFVSVVRAAIKVRN